MYSEEEMEMVKLQRPVFDKVTGERTEWVDFEAPRWVAEKQMNREHQLGAWMGVRIKPEQEPVKE